MRIYVDLDDCLYDWRTMIQFVIDDLVAEGHAVGMVTDRIEQLSATGFSFEELLRAFEYTDAVAARKLIAYRSHILRGMAFVYSDVLPWLQSMSQKADIRLVTFGYPPYQKLKWEGLSELHTFFQKTFFVHIESSKGEVIKRDLIGYSGSALFIDDNVKELRDVAEKAPEVALFQLIRYGVPQEGPWQILHSFPLNGFPV